MKTRLKLIVPFLFVLVPFAVLAQTKNISGRWTAPFNREGTPVTIVMNLVVSDQHVAGTVTHARGDVMQIQNGKLEGNKLAFDAADDDKYTYHYSGDVGEDLIKLHIETKDERDGPMLTFHPSQK